MQLRFSIFDSKGFDPMAQFFERVSIIPGQSAAATLARYGIDNARWPEVRQLQQNAHIPADSGLNIGPPRVNWLCVPIDDFMTIVNYRIVKDTVNGLRPANLSWTPAERAANVKASEHGVEIEVERDGNPCVGLHWVQTVKKRNATRFHGLIPPPEFVDTGVTGTPFQYDADSPEDEFSDMPCGPAPSTFGMGLDFAATVSLVVWTPPRVTIVEGYTYHFQIGPAGAFWILKPREATDAEYTDQVRILMAGVGEVHQDSGKNLQYRKPPQLGAINQ